MMNEHDEILLSQLADGELSSDQANEVLLDVLDAPDEREKLKGLLRLRRATVASNSSARRKSALPNAAPSQRTPAGSAAVKRP